MTSGRVLVTGAGGFFGLAIVRALSAAGTDLIATDRVPEESFLPRPGTRGTRVRYVGRDLRDEPLDDLVGEADAVVHAAALTPLTESGETLDDLLAVNLVPAMGLLRAMRTSASCRRLLYISSAGVYDQATGETLLEEDASGGTSLYGAAKLAAELVVARYAELAELEFCAVRPTSLFGPGELVRPSRPRVTSFKQLVDAVASGRAVRIEQAQSRADWLHVDDAADAVVLLLGLEHLPGRAFSLSSARLRPFSEVVAAVSAAGGLRVDPGALLVVSGGADRSSTIDNARLRATINWAPRREFDEASRSMLAEVDALRLGASGAS